MKKVKPSKPYWEMDADELAIATKEFDKPLPPGSTRPLTKAERARFECAQRSPHRSVYVLRTSDGETLVRIEPAILRRASRYAASRKLTLSDVINRSLKGMLAVVE